MRNYRKIFALVLVVGVLLGGFGAGVALVEYSSMTFVGRQTLGQLDMTTEEIPLELPATSTPDHPLYLNGNYYSGETDRSLEQDESVPAGTLTVRITYNRNLTEQPEVVLEEEEDFDVLRVYWSYDGPSDLALVFALKDRLLEDLKNHRLSEYQTVTIESVVFLINPQDRGRVLF